MTLQFRTVLRLLYMLPFAAALLFLPAWSLRFWQGWIFLIAVPGAWVVFSIWLLQADPQLMERRLRTRESDPAQRLFRRLWSVIFFPAIMLPGFDFRFGWSRTWLAPVPVWLVIAGDAIALAGSCLIFWAMISNTFAGRTIQVEAGQTVISSGPYAIVRHPFYAGMLVWALATPIALGSYIAVPLFVLQMPVVIYRLINEERTLRRDLPGYVGYCDRTKFRLVPSVW
jgi:protein-S-isoprenylcysteine O-methyltransferase Ste14